MTYKQIATMISTIGLPNAYYQFPNDTPQEPPFVVFYYDDTNDLFADNTNYQRIAGLTIEFYSDVKDFTNEDLIEQTLASNCLTYQKSEQFLDSEHMHETVYELEVLITQENTNGEQS